MPTKRQMSELKILTYVAEITEPHLRGTLSLTAPMTFIMGIMLTFAFGSFMHWRTMCLVSGVFNLASLVALFFVPESPYWLITKNRLDEAQKSLAWFRGWTTTAAIQPEYERIYNELSKIDRRPQLRLFFKKNFLWPFAIIMIIFTAGHFTGISTLITFAVQIFDTFHAPIDKYYCTTILGVVEFAGAVIGMLIVPFLGKRVLNFISFIGNGIGFLVVATYAYYHNFTQLKLEDTIDPNVVETMGVKPINEVHWLPFLCFIWIGFFAHVGIRVVPWIFVGELFSNETRANGAGICSLATYATNFVSNKVFYKMAEALTLPGIFWFYSALSFGLITLLYFIQPETEGYTLGEIQEHFSGGAKMGNKVLRNRKIDGAVNKGYIDDTVTKL